MNVAVIWAHRQGIRLLRPLLVARISAGFPSPAEDWVEGRLDLNRHLIRHPAATFYMRVSGDSMRDDLMEGDIIVVDRACVAEDGDIVVVRLCNDFAVKKLSLQNDKITLLASNDAYQPIEITGEMEFEVWGKVIITTARQLRDTDLRWVRRAMTIVGVRVVEELRGRSCLPIEVCPPSKKSLTCSRSFGNAVSSLSDLREAVASFTIRVAERLRKNQLVAGTITVFIATNRFTKDAPYYANSATVEMAYPTDATTELLERSMACTEKLFRDGYKFKSAGVMLNALAPASPTTIRMQDDEQWQRSRKLMRALDQINARMGRDTIRYGVAGFEQRWKTKFERRSHRFTTNWNEILSVA